MNRRIANKIVKKFSEGYNVYNLKTLTTAFRRHNKTYIIDFKKISKHAYIFAESLKKFADAVTKGVKYKKEPG